MTTFIKRKRCFHSEPYKRASSARRDSMAGRSCSLTKRILSSGATTCTIDQRAQRRMRQANERGSQCEKTVPRWRTISKHSRLGRVDRNRQNVTEECVNVERDQLGCRLGRVIGRIGERVARQSGARHEKENLAAPWHRKSRLGRYYSQPFRDDGSNEWEIDCKYDWLDVSRRHVGGRGHSRLPRPSL